MRLPKVQPSTDIRGTNDDAWSDFLRPWLCPSSLAVVHHRGTHLVPTSERLMETGRERVRGRRMAATGLPEVQRPPYSWAAMVTLFAGLQPGMRVARA